eukprot:11450473-Alexandrium_andersonii.AAC.1
MMTLGIITVPWLRLLRDAGAVPAVLADDLKFRLRAEEGQSDWQHAEQLCDCAELTARFIQDIGGKISVGKTVATSTSPQ